MESRGHVHWTREQFVACCKANGVLNKFYPFDEESETPKRVVKWHEFLNWVEENDIQHPSGIQTTHRAPKREKIANLEKAAKARVREAEKKEKAAKARADEAQAKLEALEAKEVEIEKREKAIKEAEKKDK